MKNQVTLLGNTIEKKNAHSFLTENGFEYMTTDINAFVGYLNPRWALQECEVPSNKRGNLAKYAGKKVVLIPTTVAGNGGARINFYIKAA